MARTQTKRALGGTLIAGGGFAGAYVARLLGHAGATIVSPENFMLYTPMLPEAASGTLEPRHVVVPLRQMCPHAELLLGQVVGARRGAARRRASRPTRPAPSTSSTSSSSSRSARSRARLPFPGLAEHALGFKNLADAIHLRNHVLRELEAADASLDPAEAAAPPLVRLRRRRLRGRRGARGALGPRPRRAALLPAPARRAAAVGARRRGAEDPPGDPAAARRVRRDGARAARRRDPRRHDARRRSRRARGRALQRRAHPDADARLDGRRAGEPAPRRARAAARRARARAGRRLLRVEGRERVWALGDCAAVPNARDARAASTRRPASTRCARRAGSRRTSRGDPERVPLPDARPGRDARPLQGHRRRPGPPPPRLPGLVRHAQRTTCTSCRS